MVGRSAGDCRDEAVIDLRYARVLDGKIAHQGEIERCDSQRNNEVRQQSQDMIPRRALLLLIGAANRCAHQGCRHDRSQWDQAQQRRKTPAQRRASFGEQPVEHGLLLPLFGQHVAARCRSGAL